MTIVRLEVGELAACCYLVAGSDAPAGAPGPCVVIDPGAEPEWISKEVGRRGWRVDFVILSHSHSDHIGGVNGLLAAWEGAKLACSAETARRAADPRLNLSLYLGDPISCRPADTTLADGEEFSAAGLRWRALEIPGHDPGEMVYVLLDGGVVFSGDTVFAGSIGRSDFPGGNGELLVTGVRGLLEDLPPETVIYPGHGPSTTAGDELEHNPFLA